MKAASLFAIAAAAVLGSAPAFAHHSFASFDIGRVVRVDGVVVEFQWTNPHAWLELDVATPDGGVDRWGIEFNSPNNLTREGWSRHMLKPGDEVDFLIHPLRDGRPGGLYRKARLADGTEMDVLMMPGAPRNFDFDDAPSPYDAE
jgi:hypothetical protein